MDFISYYHISNVNDKEFVAKIRERYKGSLWVVSEKIHGANFQIQCDKECNISCGTRKRYLPEDEDFYAHREILNRYRNHIILLFDYCKGKFPEIERVIAYGEIFGGEYPHREVPQDRGATKVQHGIWYTPMNDWMCFDILVETKGQRKLLDYKQFADVCSHLRIPMPPIIAEDITFDEATTIPCEFESRVYKDYGLPVIENNMAEGIVIRPMADYWIDYDRVILKNKNPKFREISRSTKPEQTPGKPLPDEVLAVVDEMKGYVTDNRLDNVISHGTALSYKNIGTLTKEMTEDIKSDYNTDTNDKFSKLENSIRKQVSREITRAVVSLIKARLES